MTAKTVETKNRKSLRIARVLILAGFAALAAGFLLLSLSIAAGIAAAAAGCLLAGSGFILMKKPEYLALLGW